MSDETITPEQKPLPYDWKWSFVPCILLIVGWYFICLCLFSVGSSFLVVSFSGLCLYLLCFLLRKMCVAYLVGRWKDRETETLKKQIAEAGLGGMYLYDVVIKEHSKLSVKGQLLRPSQLTQNETLLRAVTSPDTTPHEQLLRPSQTTKD